ncbi:MAG: SCO family protein [Verrucomicrobiota bacterium]
MKAVSLILAGAFFLIASALGGEEKITSYDVRGVIQELRPETREMIIRHETIPGYMDAMVMPFSVRDPQLFQQVTVGDSISFKLKVTTKEDWMEGLKVTAHSKTAVTAPKAGNAAIKPGETLSFKGIKLVDQNGRAFDLEETRGKSLALTFFFTRCPFPKMCPLLADKFAAVQQALIAQKKQDVLLLSVTIDPKHDQPDVLLRYATQYKADIHYWRIATGELSEITKLSAVCRVDFWEDQGLINHSLLTLVISPEGKVTHFYPDNGWTSEQMLHAMADRAGD